LKKFEVGWIDQYEKDPAKKVHKEFFNTREKAEEYRNDLLHMSDFLTPGDVYIAGIVRRGS